MSAIRSRSLPILLPALAAVLLLGATPAADVRANDDVVLIQFLDSTGADGNGTARARWRDKGEGETDFNIELQKLDAGSYELIVAGANKGSIAVDGTGYGEIEFAMPKDGAKPLFDFEVFGQSIQVRQGGTVYFDDVFDPNGDGTPPSGGDGSGGSTGQIEVFMVNVGPDGNAKGRLRWERKGAETRFDVEIQYLDGGSYDLVVGGTNVATFDPSGFVEVELEFRDPPDDSPSDEPGEIHFPLDFDPLGQQVEVVSGATVYLSGLLPGSPGAGSPSKGTQVAKDLGKKKGDALQVLLLDLGVLPGAKGKMKLSQSGETEFEVEIEHVADGDYGLFVGGLQRGTLSVQAGEGQLEFSSSPGAGELLLDFAVKGQLVEVKAGTDAILANVFPISVPDALNKYKKEKRSDNKLRVNLLNGGNDLDSQGLALWKSSKKGRERLSLKVQDLPAGSYAVKVDGVERGTLVVTKDDGKGKVLFDSQSGGKKLPLDFTALGALVEIVDGSDQVLVRTVLE